MKKVLLAACAGLCVIGASMASVRKLAMGYLNQAAADTTPKDSPKLSVRYVSRVLTDTTPKDSPKLAVAYIR